MEESEQMKKLINAVLKKFIKEERMLMIAEDNSDLTKKMIQMHPNYIEQWFMIQSTPFLKYTVKLKMKLWVFRSLEKIFLVLVHVPLENILHRTQQPLKSITINRDNPALSFSLNTSLSNSILNQSDFSKVISFLVFENLLYFRTLTLFLLCNQFSLSNHVKTVSFLSLLHNVTSSCKLLFFQGITKLFLFVRVNFS
mgnify:CR=1 FL=1